MVMGRFSRNGFFIFSFFLFVSGFPVSAGINRDADIFAIMPDPVVNDKRIIGLEELNSELISFVTSIGAGKASSGDLEYSAKLIIDINQIIDSSAINNLIVSDSYYLIGIYYLLSDNSPVAITYFKKSISLRVELNAFDLRLGRAHYNLGIAYRNVGDYFKSEESNLKAVEIYSMLFGRESSELIDAYSSLSSAYIELQQYEKAVLILNNAIAIAESKPDSVQVKSIANIYSNLGVSYTRLADYSRSKIYLEKSLTIYSSINANNDFNMVNLLNSLATTYSSLGLFEKSHEYYERGVKIALSIPENSAFTLNIVNSYAITLGNEGNIKRGEELLTIILKRAQSDSINDPRMYYEVLFNYAEYLREYSHEFTKSLAFHSKCMNYLKNNPDDHNLKPRMYIGYVQSLTAAGEPLKALEAVQEFIAYNYKIEDKYIDLGNPGINLIKPDKATLKLFRAKYMALNSLYKKENNLKYINAAAETSELIVNILELMRINISEEDSRLVLGDKYRDAYFAAIHDYNLLYKLTADLQYLVKTFEFSEKSKVAGLLTSTRELKATQFRIPSDIADYEFRLKNDIGLLNAKIAEETFSNSPNNTLLSILNDDLLLKTRLRDSLILLFEKKYPEYYDVKYNTGVVSLDDIPEIFGRNSNYINYLLSDSILYTFIVNRKNRKLIETRVTDSFFENIKSFRKLLSMPAPTDDALSAFRQFKISGLELQRILIEPVLPFLISDKLVISPDNILSYIPFEALPSQEFSDSKPLYRSVPYLMDSFDISYTYSATFMAEAAKGGYRFRNKVLAFAPDYPGQIDVKSLLMSRQQQSGVLNDLPYAREEAGFVADITGGVLYENADAKESVYKKESGNYEIIHLAMHTLLNDKDPMHSTLIFSQEQDSTEDRYLKTYEVYGIPTKAKMVVLSSCNTGSGMLYSGEGILSLARGFIYSGSQSVVMAMWEIEDRSGTDIVKLFYTNLKRGYTKSDALRKARIKYLKNSDQLRSHPYFWSTLIIYGDNSPLYFSRYFKLIVGSFIIVIFLTAGFYFRKRRYS